MFYVLYLIYQLLLTLEENSKGSDQYDDCKCLLYVI